MCNAVETQNIQTQRTPSVSTANGVEKRTGPRLPTFAVTLKGKRNS